MDRKNRYPAAKERKKEGLENDKTLVSPSLPASALTPGMVLEERYILEKKLGSGGMGEVFQAIDKNENNRLVAIKRMFPTQNKNARKRFEREYRFLSMVNHPNLVQAYSYFSRGQDIFMVIEFVPGKSMSAILEEKPKSLSLPEQVATANKIARGLEVVNTVGIIHRDIKPSNIIIDVESGNVKILDMGVAKDLWRDGHTQNLTKGDAIGTIVYMSPEQADGQVSQTSDIFSLGVTLYQFFLWAPRSPFVAETPYQEMLLLTTYDPPPLYQSIRDEYSREGKTMGRSEDLAYKEISNLIEKAMSKEADQRWIAAPLSPINVWKSRKDFSKIVKYAKRFGILLC